MKNLAKVEIGQVNVIQELTELNDHTGALIYLYETVLKNDSKARALKAIQTISDEFGYMPHDLSQLRYNEFYKPSMEAVKNQFDNDSYKLIYGAF